MKIKMKEDMVITRVLGLSRVMLVANKCETSIKVSFESSILNSSLNPYKIMLVWVRSSFT